MVMEELANLNKIKDPYEEKWTHSMIFMKLNEIREVYIMKGKDR